MIPADFYSIFKPSYEILTMKRSQNSNRSREKENFQRNSRELSRNSNVSISETLVLRLFFEYCFRYLFSLIISIFSFTISNWKSKKIPQVLNFNPEPVISISKSWLIWSFSWSYFEFKKQSSKRAFFWQKQTTIFQLYVQHLSHYSLSHKVTTLANVSKRLHRVLKLRWPVPKNVFSLFERSLKL